MPKQTEFIAGGSLFNKVLSYALETSAPCLPAGYDLNAYKKAFGDYDLVITCFNLFENNLNVSKTAGKLYMHRNTLIYRMAKLKRLTGLDVSKFDDAVTFMILYRCYCNEGRARQ